MILRLMRSTKRQWGEENSVGKAGMEMRGNNNNNYRVLKINGLSLIARSRALTCSEATGANGSDLKEFSDSP